MGNQFFEIWIFANHVACETKKPTMRLGKSVCAISRAQKFDHAAESYGRNTENTKTLKIKITILKTYDNNGAPPKRLVRKIRTTQRHRIHDKRYKTKTARHPKGWCGNTDKKTPQKKPSNFRDKTQQCISDNDVWAQAASESNRP